MAAFSLGSVLRGYDRNHGWEWRHLLVRSGEMAMRRAHTQRIWSITVGSTAICMIVALGGCASETPLTSTASFVPAMMLRGPQTVDAPDPVTAHAKASAPANAADPLYDLSRKSLAAKVLASRALETVTGLKTDPARLSEHD